MWVQASRMAGKQREVFTRAGRGVQRRNSLCWELTGVGAHSSCTLLSNTWAKAISKEYKVNKSSFSLFVVKKKSMWSSLSISPSRRTGIGKWEKMPWVNKGGCCYDYGKEQQSQDLIRWVWAYCPDWPGQRMGLGFSLGHMNVQVDRWHSPVPGFSTMEDKLHRRRVSGTPYSCNSKNVPNVNHQKYWHLDFTRHFNLLFLIFGSQSFPWSWNSV